MALSTPNPLTLGASSNEIGTTYSAEGAAHDIRILDQVSPDVLIMHQARVFGFYKVLQEDALADAIDPVAREIKRVVLRVPKRDF